MDSKDPRSAGNEVCPECDSDQWKSARLVYQSNTSSTESSGTANTAGVGLGSGGVGAGGARTWSKSEESSQSILAAQVEPPEQPSQPKGKGWYTGWGWFWIVLAIIWIGSFQWINIVAGIIAGLVGMSYVRGAEVKANESVQRYEEAMQKYTKLDTAWKRTRICMRCGETYLGPPLKS